MKHSILTLIIFLFSSVYSYSQIHGIVKDTQGQTIPGVHVRWIGETVGTVTDKNGHYHIPLSDKTQLLVFSSVGFSADTINVVNHDLQKHLDVTLREGTELKEVTVIQRRKGRIMDRLAVRNIEMLNAHELKKAACCNLSESFETNPSVDVSYSDAATGAKQIKLLGLSGGYVQMLTENIPNLRGLSSAYGLGYIPGPWMESIQISKGTATVKTGYEAIAGQINVEYKKPHDSDRLSLNLFTSSTGRVESNLDAAHKFNEYLSTSVLLHASDEFMTLDHNKDGYMDLPRIRQYNVANRWHYEKDNYTFQAFLRGLNERRTGGQTDGNYKIGIDTERYEFFVKNSFKFGEEDEHHEHDHEGEECNDHDHEFHRKSALSIILSGNAHNQDAKYGVKAYDGQQSNVFANLIYDMELNEHNKLALGGSFNMDMYDELLTVQSPTPFKRTEYVPGLFAEYLFNYGDLSSMVGVRADYNSVYGLFVSPRLHVRYNVADMVHLRVAAGKGYRAPNVLAENNFLLASNRELKIADNLLLEEAWNYGATAHIFVPIWSGREMGLMLEWFYTNFDNQVVVDMDSNPYAVGFYNLDGKSYSSSFQVQADFEIVRGLTATLAHRVNNVKTTINGVLREKPLTNRSKSLITLSYQTPKNKWQFDYTTQFNGGGRLPDPDEAKPLWEKEFKPFAIMNAQITKNFKKWSVYAGADNLTNFVQQHPIIDVQNPFGDKFDASMVWGPMHGRTFYVGMRTKL
ncbi:MAG TPA: TonB-dependent receptor [Bacteroidales bacterium]|nr:TonB-dependent receptor [Bacteroidales bacterium]